MTVPDTAFDATVFLATVSESPGIYRMFDASGDVLYVGKARNLKKRLTSYFASIETLPVKTRVLRTHIARIETTITQSEHAALLLEQDLIKALKPRYNILLKDDKSYAEIFFSTHTPYAGAYFHRGKHNKKGQYFGPYPASATVRELLQLLFQVFQIRQCEDSVFAHRTRPCLQHQIGRCSAPCVGLIDKETYAKSVRDAIAFIKNGEKHITADIEQRMQDAAAALQFEQAAQLRDRLRMIQTVQTKHGFGDFHGDADVIASAYADGLFVVYADIIRSGRHMGGKHYVFEKVIDEKNAWRTFIAQYYLRKKQDIPREIILAQPIADNALLQQAITSYAQKPVRLTCRVRGMRATWQKNALRNAANTMATRIKHTIRFTDCFAQLAEYVGIKKVRRIECFDISHLQGSGTIASQVVFSKRGAVKKSWRKYRIDGITPGDDSAAMQQTMTRRFGKNNGTHAQPDIVLIDGGRIQQRAVQTACAPYSATKVMAIAKGKTRKPGFETIYLPDGTPLVRSFDDPLLHCLQHIRDEAHRFAISANRKVMRTRMRTSQLEMIPGIGKVLRQRLLVTFGSIDGVARADEEALCTVHGIHTELARTIIAFFKEVRAQS